MSGIEEYTYRLYSRNLSELFVWIAATVMWRGLFRKWPLPLIAIISAFMLGQAVLIMPTSAISGSIVALFFLWEVRAQSKALGYSKERTFPFSSSQNPLGSNQFFPTFGIFIFVGLLSVLSTPLWYWSQGEFQEFWNGWYVYNTYYTEATNRTLPEIIQIGIDDFSQNWLNLAQIFLFILDLFLVLYVSVHEQRKNRLFCMMLWSCYGWSFGGILQIVVSQRFYGHYLICFVLPLLILNTLLAMYFLRPSEQKRIWYLIPSAILLVAALSLSVKTLFVGVKYFANFDFYHDPRTLSDRIDLPLFRKVKMVQHFTDPDEFMYIWGAFDMRLWEHYQRPLATRYVEQRWLIGQIYGGSTHPKWILPGTWQKWKSDMETTQPKAIVMDASLYMDSSYEKINDYPHFEKIINDQYQVFYSDERAVILIEKQRLQERIDSWHFSMPQNHYKEDCEDQEFSLNEKEEHYQLSYAIRSILNTRHFLIEVDKRTLTSHPFHLYFLYKQIKSLRLEFPDSETIRLHWELFNGEVKVCQARRLS